MPELTEGLVRPRTTDIPTTLSWYCHGRSDPTTWLKIAGRGTSASGEFVRATITPDGPGPIELRWGAQTSIRKFGPGGEWLADRLPSMLGVDDTTDHGLEQAPDEAVATAARSNRTLRIGSSGGLYHELLPTIIEQRITAGEAHRQWAALCQLLGEPAPGPFSELYLPPEPAVLAETPSWHLHPLGIERKRAEPLATVAKHPAKLSAWGSGQPGEARSKLQLLPGIGEWTIGKVLGPVCGDPDAVPVGDFHFKNMVSWALAGEARGTDERMLELLAPYAGQRGRVVRLLGLDGHGAPRFGPKKRILPMHSW
jgi:3-methyladenine DNA glycosylase/8-oxoguanine DNA glycosylase